MKRQLKKQIKTIEILIPSCSPNCEAWHNLYHAAALISVTPRHLYNLMKAGKVAYEDSPVGRRIHHQELVRFIKSRKNFSSVHIRSMKSG